VAPDSLLGRYPYALPNLVTVRPPYPAPPLFSTPAAAARRGLTHGVLRGRGARQAALCLIALVLGRSLPESLPNARPLCSRKRRRAAPVERPASPRDGGGSRGEDEGAGLLASAEDDVGEEAEVPKNSPCFFCTQKKPRLVTMFYTLAMVVRRVAVAGQGGKLRRVGRLPAALS
jgi:hypothetical protein